MEHPGKEIVLDEACIEAGGNNESSSDGENGIRYTTTSGPNMNMTVRRRSDPEVRSLADLSSLGRKSSVPTKGPLVQDHWVQHYISKRGNSGNQRAVWAGRIVFICVLFGLAVILGFIAFELLSEDERRWVASNSSR